MSIQNKARCAGGATGLDNLSSLAADGSENAPKPDAPQAENYPARITCKTVRAAQLRGCMIREILRAGAIGTQAVAALLDDDDDAALDCLRRQWIVNRAVVTPAAVELGSLLPGVRP
jgi:hypothetical protein